MNLGLNTSVEATGDNRKKEKEKITNVQLADNSNNEEVNNTCFSEYHFTFYI